jgi:hypothetical protein
MRPMSSPLATPPGGTDPIMSGDVIAVAALVTVILALAAIGAVSIWRRLGDMVRAWISPRDWGRIQISIDEIRAFRGEGISRWAEREIRRAMRRDRQRRRRQAARGRRERAEQARTRWQQEQGEQQERQRDHHIGRARGHDDGAPPPPPPGGSGNGFDPAARARAWRRYQALWRKAASTTSPHEAEACRVHAERLGRKYGFSREHAGAADGRAR